MNDYWADRNAEIQEKLTDKSIEETEEQLIKYYQSAFEKIEREFAAVLKAYIEAVADGREPSPATLYSLNRYWEMQAQLKEILQDLGDREVALLYKQFVNQYIAIYEATIIPSALEAGIVASTAFATLPTATVAAAISQIWCADGKVWSSRVWGSIEKLAQTLNDKLIGVIASGSGRGDLKRELMELALPKERKKLAKKLGKELEELTKKEAQKAVEQAYKRADTLIRTESSHIENEAASQRYQDSGIKKYKFLGREEHDIGCACKKLDGKIFTFAEKQVGVNHPPIHPNCRCGIRAITD